MKVFISWSGPRSQHIAEALHQWLPLVLQNVEPWVSRHNLEAGVRWSADLDESLEGTDYGILVLTPGHIEATWLMYEAGSLGKRVESSRVVPYCYGLEPVEIPAGPLSRFMGVAADKLGTQKLIAGMAATLRQAVEKAPTDAQLDSLLSTLWPELEAQLAQTPAQVAKVAPPPDLNDMVKEILELVRGLGRSSALGDAAPADALDLAQLKHTLNQWGRSRLNRDGLVLAVAQLAQEAINEDPDFAPGSVQVHRVTRTDDGLSVLTVVNKLGHLVKVPKSAPAAVEDPALFRRAFLERLKRQIRLTPPPG